MLLLAIYFSRPDSVVGEETIYQTRKRIGEQLARESPVRGDYVVAVPDSGVPMAMGFANTMGIPLELGLIRNHYVGRTFIEPTQEIRDFGVKLKLNPVKDVLDGKDVVVVDDSLVRGPTSTKIIRMLRQAGACRIHLRIGSPPIRYSCFYGVSTPDRHSLLATQESTKEICERLGCDSLAYLSIDGLEKALGTPSFCRACFDGSYPEEIFEYVPEQPTDYQKPTTLRYP